MSILKHFEGVIGFFSSIGKEVFNLGLVLLSIVQIVLFFLIQVVGILLGYPLVAIGLMFTTINESTRKAFTDYNTNRFWVQESMPSILYWWDNLEDSCRGDHRGWWDLNSFFSNSELWINKWWWLVVRNPFNNFKRYILGCDVRLYNMVTLYGKSYVRDDFDSTGFQFVVAFPKNFTFYVPLKEFLKQIWFPRFHIYWVVRYPRIRFLEMLFIRFPEQLEFLAKFSTAVHNRALVVELGNKVREEHNFAAEKDEYDYFKGYTFEINPFKDIS